QIAGGIIGLGLTTYLIAGLSSTPWILVLLLLVAVSLYLYSVYCGILLMKKKASGIAHSLVNQSSQLINFSIFGFGFQYISGVYLSIGLDLTNSFILTLNFGASSCQIRVNSSNEQAFLNFNLLAII